jgi:type II secretory pathway pseudopilin PulG
VSRRRQEGARPAAGPTSCRSGGVTLVELLVVIACLGVVLTPIVFVFRSGSRTALEGMARAEITLEARAVLRQVQDDLKYSTFFIDYSKPIQENTHDVFDRIITTTTDGTRFSLLRFPLRGEVAAAIRREDGMATRVPVQVVYELKAQDTPMMTLTRREGEAAPVVLSKRVNFFDVRENPAAPPKTSWLVTLQLIDLSGNKPNWTPITQTIDRTKGLAEQRLRERTQGVPVADFFAVVSSEYYTRFRRSRAVPNWQTLIGQP